MNFPLPVKADVFDIGDVKFGAKRAPRILVDTNVWVWVTRGHQSKEQRAPAYSGCIENALKASAQLLHTDHSLLELIHFFENDEIKIAIEAGLIADGRSAAKTYRQTPGTRGRLAVIVGAALAEVRSMSVAVDSVLDVDAALAIFSQSHADPADAVLAISAAQQSVPILSDDQDLATVAGVRLYTANPTAISAARKQHRLG